MASIMHFRKDHLIGSYEQLACLLPVDKLFYALKANAEMPVLRVLAEHGCKFELASLGEYERLKSIGVSGERMICGLPVKSQELIETLYGYGCSYFVFDHIDEHTKLIQYAKRAKKILRISILDIDREGSAYGLEYADFEHLVKENKEFIDKVDGLTFHIARNYQSTLIEKVFDRLEDYLQFFEKNRKLIINIGGGYRFDLPLHLREKYSLIEYYEKLSSRISKVRSDRLVEFYSEPGRGVVESSTRLISNVDLVKTKDGVREVYLELNIGMRAGTHPTEVAVVGRDGREIIYDLEFHLNSKLSDRIPHVFVDTVCEPYSFYSIPLKRKIYQGETIEFCGVGAYSIAMSSNYHGRKRPVVIKASSE